MLIGCNEFLFNSDQFQGKQVYATVCNYCQRPSEREADFLELEISLTVITLSLAIRLCITFFREISVLLMGSLLYFSQRIFLATISDYDSFYVSYWLTNYRYYCSHCDALQDATRYTKLRMLPPVLNFSLMRFVYDLSTMERRKSKNVISFPATINMEDHLDNDRRCPEGGTDHIYDLRGVLLHKGPSAYHGHYEAQVYDEMCAYSITLGDQSLIF